MACKYWQLPLWLPPALRNFILRYEPFDRLTFEANCQAAHNLRYGPVRAIFNHPDDWEFTAAQCGFAARREGVSVQWLAEQWAKSSEKN